jgi:hypothetical protein
MNPLKMGITICTICFNIFWRFLLYLQSVFVGFMQCVQSQDIVVNIMTWVWSGWPGVQIPVLARDFSLLQNDQASFGAHPASCLMGTRVLPLGWRSQGVKLATHLRLVPKLRMSGAIPPLMTYVVMVWRGTALPLYDHEKKQWLFF